MGRPGRVFTREFKQEAVTLVTAGGLRTAQICVPERGPLVIAENGRHLPIAGMIS
jgi:hypothetical protein